MSFWYLFCRFFLLAWFFTEILRLVRFLGSVSGSQLFFKCSWRQLSSSFGLFNDTFLLVPFLSAGVSDLEDDWDRCCFYCIFVGDTIMRIKP